MKMKFYWSQQWCIETRGFVQNFSVIHTSWTILRSYLKTHNFDALCQALFARNRTSRLNFVISMPTNNIFRFEALWTLPSGLTSRNMQILIKGKSCTTLSLHVLAGWRFLEHATAERAQSAIRMNWIEVCCVRWNQRKLIEPYVAVNLLLNNMYGALTSLKNALRTAAQNVFK